MGEGVISNKKLRAEKKKEKSRIGKTNRKSLKATLLIKCEGETEKLYLEALLQKYYSKKVDIKNSRVERASGTDPETVVRDAIDTYREEPFFDVVVCVFDRDSYHLNNNYQTAVERCSTVDLPERQAPTKSKLGRKPEVIALKSVPCFELWFLLTYKKATRHYAPTGRKSPADVLIDELKAEIPGKAYSKTDERNFEILGHHQKAILAETKGNSEWLEEHCRKSDTDEPYTSMHHFLDIFERDSVINKKGK